LNSLLWTSIDSLCAGSQHQDCANDQFSHQVLHFILRSKRPRHLPASSLLLGPARATGEYVGMRAYTEALEVDRSAHAVIRHLEREPISISKSSSQCHSKLFKHTRLTRALFSFSKKGSRRNVAWATSLKFSHSCRKGSSIPHSQVQIDRNENAVAR
jgi:hypothetical protein